MSDEAILNSLVEEMQTKGSLPALDETALEISRIAKKPESSTIELATVIMRDCAVASNLLATVNSSYYSPRFPIKTVSSAVTYLGFEKVFLLAFGLGLFRQIMSSMKKRKLLRLYAASYFAGIISMSLAKVHRHSNPEEIFMAGLFYKLPYICLANAFTANFYEMEDRIKKQRMSLNKACLDVFQVHYVDICRSLTEFYNLPDNIQDILCNPKKNKDPLSALVKESVMISSMFFGDLPGGRQALRDIQDRIRDILGCRDFILLNLLRKTLETDENIKQFFNLAPEDIEMLINVLEWGKANPIEVVTQLSSELAFKHSEPDETPESLIGHFITELELCQRHGGELNQSLMLAQEALFRCLPESEIFIAFLDSEKTKIIGRFYIGRHKHLEAQHFCVNIENTDSAIIQCISLLKPAHWHVGGERLGLPYRHFGQTPFQHAYLSPIAVFSQPIGICFVGRLKDPAFDERECIWIDKIIDSIEHAFSASRL